MLYSSKHIQCYISDMLSNITRHAMTTSKKVVFLWLYSYYVFRGRLFQLLLYDFFPLGCVPSIVHIYH